MLEIVNVKDKVVVLSQKSTKLILNGKKSEIILNEISKSHLNTPIFFGNDKLCGIIELSDPRIIKESEFKDRYKSHRLTEKERMQYLSKEDILYAYSFKINKVFEEPVSFVKTKDIGFLCNIDVLVDSPDLEKYKDTEYTKKLTVLKEIKVNKKDEFLKECFVELFRLYIEKMVDKKYKSDGTVTIIETETTESFVRIRLRNPTTIVDDSFRTATISKKEGIKTVIGKLKTDPKGPTYVQSVIFEKEQWSTKRALTWIKEHREELK